MTSEFERFQMMAKTPSRQSDEIEPEFEAFKQLANQTISAKESEEFGRGFSGAKIIEPLSEQEKADVPEIFKEVYEERFKDPGIVESFLEGLGDESSTAILFGGGMTREERALRAKRDLSFASQTAKGFGDVLGSIPVFTAGAAAGASAGGPVAGAAGAFALDSLIKSAYNEYLNLIEENPKYKNASFMDIVQNIDKLEIAKQTGKGSAIGAITAINPLLGGLKKIPGMDKVLSSTPGKFVTFATEVGSLTGAGAALEGRIPTAEELAQNALIIGGLKFSQRGAQNLIDGAKRRNDFGAIRNIDKLSQKDLTRLDKAKNLKEVDKILDELDFRIAKVEVKPEHAKIRQEILAEKVPEPLRLKKVDPNTGESILKVKRPDVDFSKALENVESRIVRKEQKPFYERAKETLQRELNPEKLLTEFSDDLFPIKKFVADSLNIKPTQVETLNIPLNVYRSARLSKGSTGKAEVFLKHEAFDFRNPGKVTGKSFEKILEPLKTAEESNLFESYLVAKRAIEKSAQGFKTGVDIPSAKKVVNELSKKYEPIAKEINDYQNNLLNYIKDSGLLSNEQLSKIKSLNKDYVPFQRVFESENVSSLRSGKGLEAKSAIKKFKGSERQIISPLESIIKNTHMFLELAEKNKVGQEFVKFAKLTKFGKENVKEVPGLLRKTTINQKEVTRQLNKSLKDENIPLDQKLLEQFEAALPETFDVFRRDSFTPQPNTIRVWFDGKPKLFRVPKEVYQSFKGGLGQPNYNLLTKFLALPARTLRAGAILDPRFIVKNSIRDYFGGQVFSKFGLDPLFTPFKGFMSSVKGDRAYVDWLKSGGGMSTMQSLDTPNMQKRVSQLKKAATKFSPIKFLRRAAEFSEEANRIGEYMKGIQKEGNTKLGREIAAFAARDLSIDFAKAGTLAKSLNQIIPFWNATVQGLGKPIRELYRNPESRNKTVYNLITRLAIPSATIALLNRGDPEIEELEEQEKDFNWIIRNPISDRLEKIPVPFEPGLIMNGLVRRYINYVLEDDPKAFDGYLNNVVEQAIPGVVPQAAAPILETYFNKNFFRGIPIIPRSKQGLIGPLQYKNFTSETAKKIGRGFLYMPQYWESNLSSPAIIDHFISSWTGGLGRSVVKIMDQILIATGQDSGLIRPSEGPLEKLGIDPFKARRGTKSINEFYDNYFSMKKAERSFKQAKKEGDIEAAKAIIDQKVLLKMDSAYRALSNQQALINKIYLDKTMQPEEKKELIEKLYMNMSEFTRQFNKEMEKAVKEIEKQRAK